MTLIDGNRILAQDPGNETGSIATAGTATDAVLLHFAPSTESNGAEKASMTAMGISSTCDSINEYEEEALTLLESTHSFLFTEARGSIPHVFGLGILFMTSTCLILAFTSNLNNGVRIHVDVPYNVTSEVRVAQYLSIFIALLMESGKSYIMALHNTHAW